MCFHGEEGKSIPAFGHLLMVVMVNNEDNDGGKSFAKAQKKHEVPFINAKLK